MDVIQQKAEDFRTKIKEKMPKYAPHNIINTDQCGFAYELVPEQYWREKSIRLREIPQKFGYAFLYSPVYHFGGWRNCWQRFRLSARTQR
jgi:hypothetical protein